MMTQKFIILVGFRRAALKAALCLNLNIIVWQPAAIPTKYLKHIAHIITDEFPITPTEFPTCILTQLANYMITAIIATTEKAVLPAALLREQLKLPGDSVHTAEICRDKLQMKQAAQRANILITPYQLIENNTHADELISKLQLPIVIKQRSSSGSRGLHLAHTKEELIQHLTPGHLAERFINGVELSIESFVQAGKIIFHNFTEYYLQHAINIVPAQLTMQLQQDLLAFNQCVIDAMGITSGMTHLEVYITSAGIVFGEIAIRPPGGYLMNLLKLSYGFDAWGTILKLAIGKTTSLPKQAKCYSAAWVVHPGAGTIKTVKNLDKIAALSSVKKVKVRIKPNDTLHVREGSGQDYGYILFSNASRDNLIADIEQARRLLEIEFARNAVN